MVGMAHGGNIYGRPSPSNMVECECPSFSLLVTIGFHILSWFPPDKFISLIGQIKRGSVEVNSYFAITSNFLQLVCSVVTNL